MVLLTILLLVPLVPPETAVGAGAPVPYLVRDIRSGGAGSDLGALTVVNGVLYFKANDGATSGHGDELWRSDGSQAGTTLVRDINPDGSSSPYGLTAVGNQLFFRADDGTFGRELWASDGSEAGTRRVLDINPGAGSSYPGELVAVSNRAFFHADDGTLDRGRELWESDGTTVGTALIRDIYVGDASSNPGYLTRVGDWVYFTAEDGIDGNELWRTDGRAAGTALVKDIKDGPSSSYPEGLVEVNGTLFFSADDGAAGASGHGRELWKSDGTAAGTVLVKDINTGGSSNPEALTEVNGVLFFSADDGAGHGRELWKSDGTAAGTVMVKDINPGGGSSTPDYLVALSSASFQGVLFAAEDGASGGHGYELWKSDGTEAGTQLVRDINAGGGDSYPQDLEAVGKWVFFGADDGGAGHGRELWRSDGSPEGTGLVADINPGGASSNPQLLKGAGGLLYFGADDGDHGPELWALWAFAPDLSITKTVSPATTAAPGDTVSYNLAYANQGDESAAGVVVDDVLPPELTQVRIDSDRPLTPVPGHSYRWQIGTLDPGQSGLISVSGVVQPGQAQGYTFGNTAEISSSATESNNANNSSSVEVTINYPPVATADGYTLQEDGELTVSAPGVLENDSDAENADLVAMLATDTTVGDLQFGADGGFSYKPPANYHGIVTFHYHAHDGTFRSNVTPVTVNVTSVNDIPVAEKDAYRTVEDTVKTEPAPGVLGNDLDDDGDPLTAVLDRAPEDGELVLNPDGSFVYTPAQDTAGMFTFSYHAYDGQAASDQATVTLEVTGQNDPPVAEGDSYSTEEDRELRVDEPGVLANDRDADGDELSAILDIAPAAGDLVLQPDGSFVYTPEPDYHGQLTFVYHLTDGIVHSSLATVTLEVVSVNDLPEVQDDNYKTLADVAREVAAPGVLGNDRDVDGDSLTAVLVKAPPKGDLDLKPDGGFVYTPEPDSEGLYTFKYKANDGEEDSEEATVTLTVGAQNEAPQAEPDAYTTAEDTALIIRAPGLLKNDDDPDQDLLSAQLGTPPASGDLVLDANGGFVYTPEKDFFGNVTFTYRAFDGLEESIDATVSMTVTAVNDAPVAWADEYWTSDEKAITLSPPGVLGNDRDPDGDPLNAELDAGTQAGELSFNEDGSFSYSPVLGNLGDFAFTYRASDGQVNSEPATVTIHVVESIPTYLPLIMR